MPAVPADAVKALLYNKYVSEKNKRLSCKGWPLFVLNLFDLYCHDFSGAGGGGGGGGGGFPYFSVNAFFVFFI